MSVADWPDWAQKTYWYFHGPIGNVQPNMKGNHGMSGIVWFLAIEFILGVLIVLGLWGIEKLGASGTLKWALQALLVIVLGAIMITKLFAFAGI